QRLLQRRREGRPAYGSDRETGPRSGAPVGGHAGQRRHEVCVVSVPLAICHHCGKPLPPTARRHARFCSPAHRAAYHRSEIALKSPRVRFLKGVAASNSRTASPYVEIVPDARFPGMYRLKRTDGTLSDMVNLTRAKDALAVVRP